MAPPAGQRANGPSGANANCCEDGWSSFGARVQLAASAAAGSHKQNYDNNNNSSNKKYNNEKMQP